MTWIASHKFDKDGARLADGHYSKPIDLAGIPVCAWPNVDHPIHTPAPPPPDEIFGGYAEAA